MSSDKVKFVNNLGKIITGKTPSTKKLEFWNGDIPFITPKDLQGTKHIIKTDRKITYLGASSVKGAILPANAVCISCIGVIGYVGMTTEESISNQQINSIIVNEDNDTDYVYYLMKWLWPNFKNYEGQSTTLSILNKKLFSKIEIPLHPLDYQKKMSKLLSLIDDKIETNNAINKNLEEQLNIYYKHIFGDSKASKTLTLGDYSQKIFSGGTPSTKNESYWNGNHFWLSSGETSNKFIVSTIKTITDEGVDNSSTRKADKYDIVIASAGQGHTRGQVSMLLTDSYVNQSIIVVHAEHDNLPFLYWNLANRYEELRVISNSNSIRGSLTTKMIQSLHVPEPKDSLIKMFSEMAWPAIYQIENNLSENVRLSAMRDTLLPRLMSGEIDVSGIEIE